MAVKEGNFISSTYRPAAYQLFKFDGSPVAKKDIFSVYLKYGNGTSWICSSEGSKECDAKSITNQSNYSAAVGFNNYFLMEPKLTEQGYDGTVFLREVSASYPLAK